MLTNAFQLDANNVDFVLRENSYAFGFVHNKFPFLSEFTELKLMSTILTQNQISAIRKCQLQEFRKTSYIRILLNYKLDRCIILLLARSIC